MRKFGNSEFSTKPTNYYLHNTNSIYKKCDESCETCSISSKMCGKCAEYYYRYEINNGHCVNEETKEFIKIKFTPDMLDPAAATSIYTKVKAQLRKMRVFDLVEKSVNGEITKTVTKDPITLAKRDAIAKSMIRKFTGTPEPNEPNIFNAESDGMSDDEIINEDRPETPEPTPEDSLANADKALSEEIDNTVNEFFEENPNATRGTRRAGRKRNKAESLYKQIRSREKRKDFKAY